MLCLVAENNFRMMSRLVSVILGEREEMMMTLVPRCLVVGEAEMRILLERKF